MTALRTLSYDASSISSHNQSTEPQTLSVNTQHYSPPKFIPIELLQMSTSASTLVARKCSLIIRSRAAIGSCPLMRFHSRSTTRSFSSASSDVTNTKRPVGEPIPIRGFSTIADSSFVTSDLKETFLSLETINNDGSEISLEELSQLASQPCTPLSLSDMYKYAGANAYSKNYLPQRLRNAQFLHKELPIRVAQRAVDLLTLPYGLNKTTQVQGIAHAYLRYLKSLLEFSCPQTEEQELEFTDALRAIVQDRTTIPIAIAEGIASLKEHRKEEVDVYRLQEMEKALYRFFNARTGLRLLAEHHILSCVKGRKENEELRLKQSCFDSVPLDGDESYLGCIKADCDPYIETLEVADQVMKHCKDCYGVTPHIEVLDCTPERYADSKFTYVPHHLQHVVAELLKNSCRATVRRYVGGERVDDTLIAVNSSYFHPPSLILELENRHMDGKFSTEDHVGSHTNEEGVATDDSLPSVRVIIAKGAEDVTIKIADKGGGVPRSVLDRMWTFAHSGMSDEIQSKENDTNFETDEFSGGNIRGFGLPLARIHARYFGGELTLKSMEGYGVDAYLYLPVLGQACENLPKRVQKSPAAFDSVHDANHHAYYGDSFTSSYLSGEEPWGGSGFE